MIPASVLQAIGRTPPPLRNEDRPFLVSTPFPESIPMEFGEAVARALRDGDARTFPLGPDETPDPASEARCFLDCAARVRIGNVAQTHEVLVDWNAEEDLILMAGLKRAEPDSGNLVEADGGPVPLRRARNRMARIAAEIAARTLTAIRITEDEHRRLSELMKAIATASCPLRPDEAVAITAPTPWGPASIRAYANDPDRAGLAFEIDPAFERMLPVVMEIQIVEDDDTGLDRLRIDALSILVQGNHLLGAMDVTRILSAGWTR